MANVNAWKYVKKEWNGYHFMKKSEKQKTEEKNEGDRWSPISCEKNQTNPDHDEWAS